MNLKIEFDHTKPTNAERLGTTNERWNEIAEFIEYAINQNTERSVAIDWTLHHLKDVKPCDLVMVGLIIGYAIKA